MPNKIADDFVASISYDTRLALIDIQGSIAHVTMLGRKKIIPSKAVSKIIRGLESIRRDVKKGKKIPPAEDIHFAIEKELIRRVGDAGRMMHTARSRNDQVATDLLLYLREEASGVIKLIKDLQSALVVIADKNKSVVMPGFTHLQHAQPVLFSHHILAYAWMLERDQSRFGDLLKRMSSMPLGSAALAGTSFPIDRKITARLLGFKAPSDNSIDATASRDAAQEFLSACAILQVNLSRLAEELIIWSSSEFSYITMGRDYTTGSSIMPQKRNPDMAELVRGKTGRVIGDLVNLLTAVKGTPLAYNRDLQEDKPPVFDAVDTVKNSLIVSAGMIRSLKVNKKAIKAQLDHGFLAATEVADYLVRKGVPFRTAHGVVGSLVQQCEKTGKRLDQLSLPLLKKAESRFERDVYKFLKPETVVSAKTSFGGTSPKSVRTQLASLRKLIRKK